MTIDPAAIAQVTHEANRAWQILTGDPAVSPHWDDAPDWQRDSAVEGVVNALQGRSPEESHVGWCDYKVRDGWVYGPVKDPELKTHPCLVPYAELPADQRIKDELFLAIVAVLGAAT